MTPLDKPLKRSLRIGKVDYVLTVAPEALKLTQKGKRNGLLLAWHDLVSGESALAVALRASVGQFTLAPAETNAKSAPKSSTAAPSRRHRKLPR
jgi:hypothetical protein